MAENRRGNLLVLIVCYLLALEGLSWFTASSPPCLISAVHQQQSADNDHQKDCPTLSAGAVVFLARVDHFIESHDKSIVAGFTVILAISTIGLWLATVRLWRATNNTLDHAEIASERQLRAYIVAIVGSQVRQGGTRGLRFEFRPIILNTGQTPAYEVNIATDIRFMSFNDARQFDFKKSLPPPRTGVLTLGPRQDKFTQIIYPTSLTRPELRELRSGAKQLWVYGTIGYRDAFHRPRYTNFCFFIGWWGKRGSPLWQAATVHNDCN